MFDDQGNGFFEDLKVNELFTTGAVPGVRFRKDVNNYGTCIEDGSKSQAFHDRAAVVKIARAPAQQSAAPANPTTKPGRKGWKAPAQDESTDSASADSAPAATSDAPVSDPTAPATSDDL